MFKTFANAWKIPELRKKILFTALIVLIFRVGSAIPVPFTNILIEGGNLVQEGSTFLNYLIMMTGDAFNYGTLFALSITPYINSSIIMQLLCVAIPPLERLAKEEDGQKKIASITRYVTVVLGIIQSVAYYFYIRSAGYLSTAADGSAYTGFAMVFQAIVIILCFTAGTALIMWLGEQINDKGIGNGISIILFVSIVARFPNSIIRQINNVANGDLAWWVLVLMYLGALLLIVLIVIAGILAGAVWAVIPAIFKAKWNTNETLFTLMMNYIAIQLTSFAVSKWENPPGSNSIGTINSKGDVKYVGWIGNMFSDGYNKDFMWTVIIVLVLAALVYLYLKYTKHGYEIAVVGDSENTARYAGIRVPRIYVRTMALSGALCGFAGFLAVSAVSHTLSTETAGGRGFTAIIVAWLAKMNPFVMILISALLSFLDKGAVQIASDFGLNEYVSQIISGVILFFILGSEFFINYQVKTGAKHK